MASPSWSNSARIVIAAWAFVLSTGFSFLGLSAVLSPKGLERIMSLYLRNSSRKDKKDD
jgi:hypothetical protein